ncbi:MAG: hypothetical protein OEM82_00210 [Acidobacteriota bacterium]|nr:hypothetical protein [Acidobacteriota bacterium]MDH3530715.1 hypothetical protein [Acidobacteriota bacterium]
MFELKQLSHEGVGPALERAKHYRLLNEPGAAESICRDILRVDPNNQEALITIVLAMSDRIAKDYTLGASQIKEYVSRITDEYQRTYYTGIIFERRGKAALSRDVPGSEHAAYDLLRQAMDWFDKAWKLHPEGNEDVVLRWNGCARVIMSNNLGPREMASDMIE